MAGTVNDSGENNNIVLNLGIKPSRGCAGTAEGGSDGGFKLIVIGKTVYIDPDAQFWKSQEGSGASAAWSWLINAGRYPWRLRI